MDTVETSRARPVALAAPSSPAFLDPKTLDRPSRAVPLNKSSRREAQVAEPIPAPLLLEATRVAGMFQRSALGHLDHHEWLDRVGKDGQRLIDVLAQMGFVPKSPAKAG